MNERDYYEILGIDSISDEDIRRELALKGPQRFKEI